ncbi:MAG: hypothetical protein IJ480_03630 [Clostridia bacterium]|nr:hypothetical protein [Clostridia bacterium]
MDGDISGMLRQMMDNPQFGAMVNAVKSQMGDGESGGMDMAKMMEKLPEMMQMLGPVMGAFAQKEDSHTADEEPVKTDEHKAQEADAEKKEAEVQDSEEKEEAGAGKLPEGSYMFKPGNRDKRNKLLCALKPYLSPARCALVDRAMSAMQLGEILGTVMPPKN